MSRSLFNQNTVNTLTNHTKMTELTKSDYELTKVRSKIRLRNLETLFDEDFSKKILKEASDEKLIELKYKSFDLKFDN